MSPRLTQILKMLEKQPNDAFLLYGAGMEHKKAANFADAVTFFDRCIAADPAYCYAYFQKGESLQQAGDTAGARAAYQAGIVAAKKAGDEKALGELSSALSMV
jgi:tetratricopeptide (TPR) repeat protein